MDKGTIIGHVAPVQHDADGIDYSPAVSGLLATDVQAAIDEVSGAILPFPWATYLTDTNVKGWWKLDSLVSGLQLLDSSGNGNTMEWGPLASLGTLVDAGLYDKGFHFFNPTGWPSINVLWCPLAASLRVATNLTAELIFNSTVSQNSSALMSCMDIGEQTGWEVFDRITTINFSVRTTTGIKHLSVLKAAFYGLNEWVHVRVTYDGAFMKIYTLNYSRGEIFFTLVGSMAATGNIVYNVGVYNMFTVGARWFETYGDLYSGHDHFGGTIDQIAVSDTIRTSTEGYQDTLPRVDVAVNLGHRLRRFDTVNARRFIGVLENFDVNRMVYVSNEFIESTATRRFQTLANALAYVATQTPTATSPWSIYAYPGVYPEDVTMLPYLNLQMPVGQITGTVTVVGNSSVNLDRVVSGAANGIRMLAAETATAYAWANYVETTTATAILNQSSTTGVLVANVRQIRITGGGLGLGDFTANGHMHVTIGDIYLAGNASTGVISGSGGGAKPIVGRIDHILVEGAPTTPRGIVVLSGGEVDLNVGELLIPTGEAYHVYTGGVLNMFTNEKNGTETNAGTAHVTDASHGTNILNPHSTTFLKLPDCPATYVGKAGQAPIVNAAQNALAFQDVFAPTGILFVSPQFTNDGARKYTTIQAAINAAVAGDLILVYPGTYNESLTLKPSTTVEGVDRDRVIINQTNTGNPCVKGVISNVNYDSFTIKNVTLRATGTSKAFDLHDWNATGKYAYFYFTNVLSLANSATSYGYINNAAISTFEKCDLRGTGDPGLCFYSDTLSLGCTFTDCLLATMRLLGGWGAVFTNCQNMIVYATNKAVIMNQCTITSDATPSAPYDHFVGVVNAGCILVGCQFDNTGSAFYPVQFTGVTGPTILNNTIFSGTTYGIYATDVCAATNIDGNIFDFGINGNIQITKPIKNVGAGVDFYATVQDALTAVVANGAKIVLQRDFTITAALTPPGYAILIDGNNQFKITRSAGNPLMTLDANDNVKFINIDLVGSIDVAGNGAQLFLADHTFLTGLVDVQSGDANTLVKLDQCKVTGDATDKWCIRLANANPTVVVKRASLKGSAGNPAIYWDGGVTNNNLKIAYTGVIHGSVGANVPFGRNAAQTPTVASHHDAFNADPFAATWTNSIGTPYDVVDVDADY